MASIRWLGLSGFKISFKDKDDIVRCIYFDTYLDNPITPEDYKTSIPDDADLVLVSHGHFIHAASAPDLV